MILWLDQREENAGSWSHGKFLTLTELPAIFKVNIYLNRYTREEGQQQNRTLIIKSIKSEEGVKFITYVVPITFMGVLKGKESRLLITATPMDVPNAG